MAEMTQARDIRPGDVILASSPRYNGPTIRVTGVEHVVYGAPFSARNNHIVFNVERMSGSATRLLAPMDRSYLVERVAQQALREFADPPPVKPEEPTGLGAVVEDSAGDLWVRDKTTTTIAHWKRARGQMGGKRLPWSAIDAVRVLSEGIGAPSSAPLTSDTDNESEPLRKAHRHYERHTDSGPADARQHLSSSRSRRGEQLRAGNRHAGGPNGLPAQHPWWGAGVPGQAR